MTPTNNEQTRERAHALQAMSDGMRQEWKVTFYEVDDNGDRKTGTAEVGHTRYITTLPIASPRVVGHTVFHHLHTDPNIPELHMSDYDIERTKLLTAEEDQQP